MEHWTVRLTQFFMDSHLDLILTLLFEICMLGLSTYMLVRRKQEGRPIFWYVVNAVLAWGMLAAWIVAFVQFRFVTMYSIAAGIFYTWALHTFAFYYLVLGEIVSIIMMAHLYRVFKKENRAEMSSAARSVAL